MSKVHFQPFIRQGDFKCDECENDYVFIHKALEDPVPPSEWHPAQANYSALSCNTCFRRVHVKGDIVFKLCVS